MQKKNFNFHTINAQSVVLLEDGETYKITLQEGNSFTVTDETDGIHFVDDNDLEVMFKNETAFSHILNGTEEKEDTASLLRGMQALAGHTGQAATDAQIAALISLDLTVDELGLSGPLTQREANFILK